MLSVKVSLRLYQILQKISTVFINFFSHWKKFEINLIESGSNFFRIVSTKGSKDSKLEAY